MKTQKSMSIYNFNFIRERFHKSALMTLLSVLIMFSSFRPATGQGSTSRANDAFIAQMTSALEKSEYSLLSIQFSDVTLQEALEILAKKINVGLSYNPEIIPHKKVTFSMTNVSYYEVIYQLLEGTNLEMMLPSTRDVIVIREKEFVETIDSVAQNIISGKVVDAESGEGIPGVNIVVRDSELGTVTDIDGNYELQVPSLDVILEFLYIGFRNQVIPVDGRSEIDVALQPQVIAGEELVVVGYGTMRKNDLAGAVSTVSNESFERMPVTNPLMSLQGRAAGLRVVSNSGLPGASASIRVRGEQSISGTNSPIFVVDGNITNNIDHINSQDIESVSVLKDASAVAIYGSRGANGVILVNTKRGSSNTAPSITFHTYGAVQQESNLKLDLLNADEFLEIYTEAYTNMGTTTPWDQEDLAQYKGVNSDWLGAIVGTGYLSNSDLSVSGGSENSTYFVSTNYTDHKGMVTGTDFNRISFRLNTDHQIRDWLKFSNSLNLFSSKQNGLTNQFNGAIQKVPITRIYEDDGSFGRIRDTQLEHMHRSPVFLADNINEGIRRGVLGSLYLTVSLLEGLEFTARSNVRWTNDYTTEFAQGVDPSLGWEGSTINTLEKENNETLYWQTDYLLNYEGSIGEDHYVNGLLGYSREEETSESLMGSGNGTPSNEIRFLNAADPTTFRTDNDFTDWSFIGMFGRIGYTFRNRYILNATIRRDGSSRLAQGYQYGVFPSVSAAWRISGEDFMDSFDWLSELKLRASWGTVGNVLSISTYGTKSSLANRNYVLGQSQQPSTGYSLTSAVNTNLQWETTEKKNVGLDIELFENKFYVFADYFIEDTYDLLFTQPIPMSTGLSGSPFINAGQIRNTGVEFDLGYRQVVGDWRYSVSVNLSHFKNRVINLDGRDLRTEGIVEGYTLKSFFGFKSNGLIRTEDDLNNHPHYPGKKIGDIWLLDINGFDEDGNLTGASDGVVNAADRTLIGDDLPTLQYGAMGTVGHKNFTLQLHLQGAQGVLRDIRGGTNLGALHYFTQWAKNHDRLIMDRYHAVKNPNGQYPRVTANDAGNNLLFSDFWISDASYLRISNVNLRYDFSNEFNQKLGVSSLGAYVSVQNLYTFTSFYGPEVDSNSDVLTGVPQPRTWTLGFKVGF